MSEKIRSLISTVKAEYYAQRDDPRDDFGTPYPFDPSEAKTIKDRFLGRVAELELEQSEIEEAYNTLVEFRERRSIEFHPQIHGSSSLHGRQRQNRSPATGSVLTMGKLWVW